MKSLAVIAMVLFGLMSPARGQEDRAAGVQAVIDAQIAAFLADDLVTAFGYASDGIQRFFGTPENFGRMVKQGYPMVWRPAQVDYLGQHAAEGMLWQRVAITDRTGARFVLEYAMVESPEGWRIAAVRFVEDPPPSV